jgi:hypothetical protein
MTVDVLYVDYYGRIPTMFYDAVARTAPWQEIKLYTHFGYISNDNTLPIFWPNFSVIAFNDGSHDTQSSAQSGPHPLNPFTVLCLVPLLLNQKLDGINSFVDALPPIGKMSYTCTIRIDDPVPSLPLTNGCALRLMLFGPLPLRYGANATTNYMDTMENYPTKQNARSL